MLLAVVVAALGFLLVERLWPDTTLPRRQGWYLRAAVANLFQLAVVVMAGLTWDGWFVSNRVFSFAETWPPVLQGGLGYFVTTFVYYFWHRARHDVNFLWLLCHQLHHSPARIEVVTSFYKHPVELAINSMLSGAISYLLLGLTVEGAAWVTFFSGVAEFFYHMNVRTPHWVGYFIQRPEMHRIHHQFGRHYDNFADLPIWDMLFGTYNNPKTFDGGCGFRAERELRLLDMVLFRNVNGKLPRSRDSRGK